MRPRSGLRRDPERECRWFASPISPTSRAPEARISVYIAQICLGIFPFLDLLGYPPRYMILVNYVIRPFDFFWEG
ncbi:hypothetical protein BJY00DRAFT_96187 [Aspergillus carlsbadensis]|nr:hypothetical protein BJY00DRAFT_96187 [Aspergillus carlsbadensis]